MHIYAHNIYVLYAYVCLYIYISMYIVSIYVSILYNTVTI